MESIECDKNGEEVVAQLSLEQKARLDQAVKQAELSLVSQEVLNESLAAAAKKLQIAVTAQVAGTLYNVTNGPLSVTIQHIYEGKIYTDYTRTISSGNYGGFTMLGTGRGVEAVVVYSGKNNSGTADCGWLLGYRAINGTLNVYGMCGPISIFIDPNFEYYKNKIESGATTSWYHDPTTRTDIYAAITGTNGSYSVVGYFF